MGKKNSHLREMKLQLSALITHFAYEVELNNELLCDTASDRF